MNTLRKLKNQAEYQSRINLVIDAIHGNIAEPLRLETLATYAGFSRSIQLILVACWTSSLGKPSVAIRFWIDMRLCAAHQLSNQSAGAG